MKGDEILDTRNEILGNLVPKYLVPKKTRQLITKKLKNLK